MSQSRKMRRLHTKLAASGKVEPTKSRQCGPCKACCTAMGVEALEKNPDADISGSSKMYLLLTRENVLMTTGPFHDKHATAATWTVRRRCAETHRFDETKERGEEVTFTKGWKVNVVQVPAEDMIVVMGHSRNTVDKSDLMKRPQVYNAQFVNQANGKMCVRIRWPTLPWDLFRSTFSV